MRDKSTVFLGLYRSELIGAVKAGDLDPLSGRALTELGDYDRYRCEPMVELSEYQGRLTIAWGAGYRQWKQHAENAKPFHLLSEPPPLEVVPLKIPRGTTAAGFSNPKGQVVVGPTALSGNDHGQRVYLLQCSQCGLEYGANGSDIWQRKCPQCGGGAEGLPASRADLVEETKVASNPPWTRDELILALDLYFQQKAAPLAKGSAPILELSGVLNRLAEALGGQLGSGYRNPNGVYMKLMNFRRFDPDYQAAGKVGLSRGNHLEGEVWATFAEDLARLRSVADGIRGALEKAPITLGGVLDDEFAEGFEGRVFSRLHVARERDRKLIQRRKDRAMREQGALVCEGCSFDFVAVYGERGRGFIECHHVKAVETLAKEGERVTEKDLALVCSNCHRMIHASRPWLSLDALRAIVRTNPR